MNVVEITKNLHVQPETTAHAAIVYLEIALVIL